ncbi:hypothetical protein F503_07279 [Ophiostoma piceae UAMH 11346]|uniref:Uncharacterized protein n=1 Tax=Ophiostoma piceae (strain UAMH 11346) TaxID=1262450 RepID=S3CS83_OPHP1|nr:hypothetical protein F503_07279 [Ophiostoma piceae UAMH 11346]
MPDQHQDKRRRRETIAMGPDEVASLGCHENSAPTNPTPSRQVGDREQDFGQTPRFLGTQASYTEVEDTPMDLLERKHRTLQAELQAAQREIKSLEERMLRVEKALPRNQSGGVRGSGDIDWAPTRWGSGTLYSPTPASSARGSLLPIPPTASAVMNRAKSTPTKGQHYGRHSSNFTGRLDFGVRKPRKAAAAVQLQTMRRQLSNMSPKTHPSEALLFPQICLPAPTVVPETIAVATTTERDDDCPPTLEMKSPRRRAQMIHQAGRITTSLIQAQPNSAPGNDIIVAYWHCFIGDSEALLEFSNYRSGVHLLADAMPVPDLVDADNDELVLLCFLSRISLSRLLNRVYDHFYSFSVSPGQTAMHQVGLETELESCHGIAAIYWC